MCQFDSDKKSAAFWRLGDRRPNDKMAFHKGACKIVWQRDYDNEYVTKEHVRQKNFWEKKLWRKSMWQKRM